MKTRNGKMKTSVLSLAVQGALATMCTMPMTAFAADPSEAEIAVIRRPTNFIEAGIENISQKSAKFGEYNGLNKSGGEFVGSFSVRGGDAYEGGNGTFRWGITGTDLGTTSREFGATAGSQGTWNLKFGYDELRHNITDTYQTPQQGSMGGNTFTLPATFGVYNGATTATTATVPPSTRAVPASALHTEEVGTTRKNTSFGASFNVSQQLSLQFDYNHLAQSGAKLMGSAALGGQATGGVGTWRAEALSIVMNPTNYTTDTFNLGLNWVGDKGHLSGSYFGSVFKDGFDRLTWQNPIVNAAGNTAPAGVYQNVTMSTAPSNQFHQLNLTGGYAFSGSTKLTGGVSYGRNTQNDSFLTGQPELVTTPRSSLDGLVITRHADLKLTNQTTKDLALSAAYKYNERDNRTPSSTYIYKHLGNANYTGVNTPYSNRKTQFELAADYRLTKAQSLRLAYEREASKRWCNNVADGYQCVASPSSDEDKLALTYRVKASEDVRLNAGYAYAKRNADFDQSYVSNAGDRTLLLANTNHGVLNGGNFLGFAAYPYASRSQDILKAGVNWQASDKLEVGLSGRYSKDKYNATLGVQDGQTGNIHFDATYSYSESSTLAAYASWQNSERELRNASAPAAHAAAVPTTIWTNKLSEDSNSLGLTTKHTGLMGGKLELNGDLSYSLDKSRYSTQVPYLATCSATGTLSCGDLPDIKSKLLTLKLTGIYSLDKSSKIAVAYVYQRLNSEDYQYNWFQLGYTGTRGMPTNEQAPNYSENVVAVSYIYNFK
jgi:MtrB/PioB family decaheme-associated outer membrane protein